MRWADPHRNGGHDKPDFNLAPEVAGPAHWRLIKSNIPAEFEEFKDFIWIEPTNEIDTHTKAEWLGWFMFYCGTEALKDGYKVAMSGFNAGQPEPEHWKLPGMRAYLELCAIWPERVAISLHEGKTDGDKDDDIEGFVPHMIGRYQWLFAACDEMGIKRPTTFISEWAWNYASMPGHVIAESDLDFISMQAAEFPELRGIFLWNLAGGSEWANLPNQLAAFMPAVKEYALVTRFGVPVTPMPPEEPEEPEPEPEPVVKFEEHIQRIATERQVIHFNAGAALQKRMVGDRFVPMSEEFEFEWVGKNYIGQSAYNLQGQPERVYFCLVGQWNVINWLPLM